MQQLKLISLQQPIFHLEQTAETGPAPTALRLLVQTGDHFTGFLVYDAATRRVCRWMVLPADLHQNSYPATEWHLQSSGALSWLQSVSFEKIHIISYTARSTAVPAGLTNGLQPELFTDLMLGNKTGEIRLQDAVSEQSMVRYYTCAAPLHHSLQNLFPGAAWQHVQSCYMQQEPAVQPQLRVSVYFNQVLVTAEANRQWLLSQTYEYHTPEDLLYHILKCMEELQLDAATTPVFVDGFLELHSPLASILQQYLAQLSYQQTELFQFPAGKEEEQNHTLALADRILTCVS